MEVNATYKSWETYPEMAPVRISFVNNVIMLNYEGGDRAGLLISEPLSRLVRECSVTLNAAIYAPSKRQSVLISKASYADSDIQTRPLRVVVYGLMSEKDVVTSILDKGSLFLQRPDEFEYDQRVRYFNPMYLLRPGDLMPSINGLSTREGQGQTVAHSDEMHLGEVERLRMLKLFDEASGSSGGIPRNLKQSSRIISVLKECVVLLCSLASQLIEGNHSHQLEALAMMVERENGASNGKFRFPSMWQESLEEGRTMYVVAWLICVTTPSQKYVPLPLIILQISAHHYWISSKHAIAKPTGRHIS